MKMKVLKYITILILCFVSFYIVNFFCNKIKDSKEEINKIEYQKVVQCYMDIPDIHKASFNKLLNEDTNDFKISRLEYKIINKRFSCELYQNKKWQETVYKKTQ